jgi:hypothetical protein
MRNYIHASALVCLCGCVNIHDSGKTVPENRTELLVSASCKGGVNTVKSMLNDGVQINGSLSRTEWNWPTGVVQPRAGWTPLHAACACHQVEVARLLINAGADLNRQDGSGAPPLYYAIVLATRDDSNELVKLLIAEGAIVNYAPGANPKAFLGTTPLHIAVEKENLAIVKTLLDAGAHINEKDIIGCTPLDFCDPRRNTEAIRAMLKAHGARNSHPEVIDAIRP